MIRLLVSVRSPEEAVAAMAGGADLIDVKEPNEGPLGAANSKVWRAVAKEVGDKLPLSVALGELNDFPAKLAEASLTPYTYAKIGLAGCADSEDWKKSWKEALSQIPKGVQRTAVAYADYATARSPQPKDVLLIGKQNRCKVFMLDTYDKSRLDVFDLLPGRDIKRLFDLARENGMIAALAGSLKLGRLAEALEVDPDIIAVRGGVCSSSRNGELSAELVKIWKTRFTHKQRGPKPHITFSE